MAFGGVPSILGGSSGGGAVGPTLTGISSVTSPTGTPLTLATLDTNQNVVVSPNGSGALTIGSTATDLVTWRKSGTGTTGRLYADGTNFCGIFDGAGGTGQGVMLNNSANSVSFYAAGTIRMYVNTDRFMPLADNAYLLAAGYARWLSTSIGPNGVAIGGSGTTSTFGEVNTAQQVTKPVTAIANAVATGVLTITIPNAAHSATVRVTLNASLGAGGGGVDVANQATAAISYDIAIARIAGSNAVAAISSAFGSTGSATVATANSCTVTAAMSAVSGAVGATNTFTVNATISRGAGTSTNHTCLVKAEVINSNATGITLS